jgi:hypothetical protein
MKEIKLTKGYVALVDDEDFERVSQFKWYPKVEHKEGVIKRIYANRSVQEKIGAWTSQAMHTFIVGLGRRGKEIGIDHKDHNGLNNQRYNLRVATKTQNMRNMTKRAASSSDFKGVEFTKRKILLAHPWRARITVAHNKIHLGYFSCPLEAACAYDMAAVKYFGEFASCNFARPD